MGLGLIMKTNTTYPKYYNVDNIPIILTLTGNTILGRVANGKPYPIGKAIVEGFIISKAEYIKLAKSLYSIEPIKGDEDFEIKKINVNTK